MRPIVRYHGGKWLLAPWIISRMPAHKVYCEPYGGGGSVLLRKPRSYVEIYNDLNDEIVNVFKQARDNGDQLEEKIKLTPFSRKEFELSYQDHDDPIEQARRTILRSFQGYGSTAVLKGSSGFRANSRGDAIPSNTWREYTDDFQFFLKRLQGVIIENRPAAEVMAAHDSSDTLHYIDPPYVFETRGKISENSARPKHTYAFEMTDQDHRELAETLGALQGMVMVSGYRCDLYDELFAGWHREDKAALADGAKKRVECLWMSPNIPTIKRLI